MATNGNSFVVNIVDLQNISTDIRGTNATTILQDQVANLQTMVDTTTHTIYADALSNFTPGRAIDIYADLNLSNVGLYSNSNVVYLNTNSTITGTSGLGTSIETGSNTTGSAGSNYVFFSSMFTYVPNPSAIYYGTNPVFMTVGQVSVSSFTAYSWSNSLAFAGAPFLWQAV